MSQPTAFISGSELYSVSLKESIFFANIVREKRGNYKFVLTPMYEYSKEYTIGQITTSFVKNLENAIKNNPENYLWSHRKMET